MNRTTVYQVIGFVGIGASGSLVVQGAIHDNRLMSLVGAIVAFTSTGFLVAYLRRANRELRIRLMGPAYCVWNDHCKRCPKCQQVRERHGSHTEMCEQGRGLYHEFCREKLA